jgi:hypothetical protein
MTDLRETGRGAFRGLVTAIPADEEAASVNVSGRAHGHQHCSQIDALKGIRHRAHGIGWCSASRGMTIHEVVHALGSCVQTWSHE